MRVGIFVGGGSRRMGGRPKGLLLAPDGSGERLVERAVRLVRAQGAEPVLVGEARAYAGVCEDVPRLADAPHGIGPLGGLRALLLSLGDAPQMLALACDMPVFTAPLLERLVREPMEDDVAIVAPHAQVRGFEPFFAKYVPARVLPTIDALLAERCHKLQELFTRLPVRELALDEVDRRALVDWDTPEEHAAGAAPLRDPRGTR